MSPLSGWLGPVRELPLTADPAPLVGVPLAERTHRQHYLPGRLVQVVTDHVGMSTLGMTPAEHAEAAVELERVIGMLTGLQLDHLAHLDHTDHPARSGASSTAGWLRAEIPVTLRAARRKVRLAKRIDRDLSRLGEVVASGQVLPEQAEVIAAAVDALPADLVDAPTRARAEAHLVELAARHDPDELRRLGDRILQVVAPEVADAVDAARLAAMERDADRSKSLRMAPDGHGSVRGRFTIPDVHAAMLEAALAAFTNPARPDPIPRTEADPDVKADPDVQADPDAADCAAQPGPRWRPGPDVLGEAFCQLLESLDPATLPRTSGMNATVVAIVPASTLTGDPGWSSPHTAGSAAATPAHPTCPSDSTYTPSGQAPGHLLGTNVRLSPAQSRRLACRAGVIPAVLDGAARVLDLGRRSRLASPAQILALRIHQAGQCAIAHCDRPAHACEAHHWRQPWATGGRTDLADLILICTRHHTLAHTTGYQIRRRPDGQLHLERRE
jgi:uncharacterized protein DUF222